MKKFVVDKEFAGKRADVFLVSKLPGYTRSTLGKLFANKTVKLNNLPAKASNRLKPGNKLQVDTSMLEETPTSPDLNVIYEDKDVIVIDKPEGLLTHSKGSFNNEATVASFISSRLNDKTLLGNRAGIVHRLDRQTSGVIIAARNKPSQDWLQKQFSTRKVNKSYLAIVPGELAQKEFIIDAPIGRNPKKPQTFKVMSSGKPSLTRVQVIKTFRQANSDYSLVKLEPRTGRTHQLRVHLAYINHPIVGDSLYGQVGKHLYLHASQLELKLPDKKIHKFSAKPPQYFKDFVDGKNIS